MADGKLTACAYRRETRNLLIREAGARSSGVIGVMVGWAGANFVVEYPAGPPGVEQNDWQEDEHTAQEASWPNTANLKLDDRALSLRVEPVTYL